jgi:adenosine deaminase
VRLRVVDELASHPLRRMMDKGVVVTINSDDPAYFGGYVNRNYLAASNALALGAGEIATIVCNSIEASLMARPKKETLLAEIDRVLAGSA